MKTVLGLAAAASLSLWAAGAQATPATIDFNGLDGGRDGVHAEQVGNFYNGGLGSLGAGPGPDFGVTFHPIDATSNTPIAICNVTADCAGHGNSLFILGDQSNGVQHGAVMHFEAGFRGIMEFDASGDGPAFVLAETDHADPATSHTINGAVIARPDHPCARLECPFLHYRINLADDEFTPDDVVSHDVLFLTRGIDALFVDNITFSDLILPETGGQTSTVPEPSSAAMIGSIGLIGTVLRRRRRGVKAA